MKKYTTNDGETFEAENARDVVRQLRAGSRDPEPNVEAFMRQLAHRVKQTSGAQLPTNSESEFVEALLRTGLLTEVQEP